MNKLSIIIPCYNEEECLPHLFDRLNIVISKLKKNYSVDVIFVDDGSTDKTNELLHKYYGKKSNVRIIKHNKNKNLGAALKTGFGYAAGDFIATLDSDCTYNPKLILEMIKLMDKETDIITVSPYHPKGRVNNVPRYRLFLSKTISWIYKILLNQKIYTYTAMMRIYRKNVIKKVRFKADNFLGVTEIMIKAILYGYKVKELPAELNVRKYGVSKMKTLSVIINHLGMIGKILAYKTFGSKI